MSSINPTLKNTFKISTLSSVLMTIMGLTNPAQATVTEKMGSIYSNPARTQQGEITINGNNPITLYYRAENGDTGKLILTPLAVNGYGTRTIYLGNNGLMIKHSELIQKTQSNSDDADHFQYNIEVIPDDKKSEPTVRIAQASYNQNGNSDVAQQTLSYTAQNASGATATYHNPSVDLDKDAVSDYIMGTVQAKQYLLEGIYFPFTSPNTKSEPQLRTDSYGSNHSKNNPAQLFYINYKQNDPTLANNSNYSETWFLLNKSKEIYSQNPNGGTVYFANNRSNPISEGTPHYGVLPSDINPSYSNDPLNISKDTSINPNNKNAYQALGSSGTINNGSSYVTYGVDNSDSQYYIDVKNARTVTLDYRGIMFGSGKVTAPTYGETYDEWISFGIDSKIPGEEPPEASGNPTSESAPFTLSKVTCPAGWVSDYFERDDYVGIAPPRFGQGKTDTPILNTNVIIGATSRGNDNQTESYLSVDGFFTPPTQGYEPYAHSSQSHPNSFIAHNNYQNRYLFDFSQNLKSKYDESIVTYNFKNQLNGQPLALDNFTLTIYDIDQPKRGSKFLWKDRVKIIGYHNKTPVTTLTRLDKNTSIQKTDGYYYHTNNDSFACNDDTLGAYCAMAVQFQQPIDTLEIHYGNVPYKYFTDIFAPSSRIRNDTDNPTQQNIAIQFNGYCYRPLPKIIYTKKLSSDRINTNDQFQVKIKDNNTQTHITDTIVHDTTQTKGTGQTVTLGSGTTGEFKLNPEHSYTLEEVGVGSTDLSKYNASYECIKENEDSTTTLTGNIIPANQLKYGDRLECTVTNSIQPYTISGVVFNDNGGMNDNESDPFKTDGDYANPEYFNGRKYPTENTLAGGTITLNKCDNSIGTPFTTQTLPAIEEGYTFTLTPKQVGDNYDNLCLTQKIPKNDYIFNVDTTPNIIKVPIQPQQYDYPNNNFGQVIQKNSALVLEKRQYVNDCNITDLKTINNHDISPLSGYSKTSIDKNSLEKVTSQKCIAYKITATNRGHINISDVIIKDGLSQKSVLTPPEPALSNIPGIATEADSVTMGNNGEVVSKAFELATGQQESFFFNTKYKKKSTP